MNFQKILPHLVAILVFVVAVVFTFSPAFSGKIIRQGDNIAGKAPAQELYNYQKETGERALWTNSQFGGMPTYQIINISEGNQLNPVSKLFRGLGLPYPAGIFFSSMLAMYLALLLLGVNPWLGIVGALAFSLASNNLILFETGHNTKLRTIAYFPLIIAGVVTAWRKQYLLGGLVFALGMGLSLFSNHPQLLYYFGLTVPIFGIGMLVETFKTKDYAHFGKTLGILMAGLVLALGSSANATLPTLEYAKQTMRGEPILKTDKVAGKPQSSSETEGLEWTYAMNWSNNFEDIVASIIPRAAGGGSGEEISRDTPFGKAVTRLGARLPESFQAPTYHGGQPFTSGPRYLGAVVWFLFFIGVVSLNGPLRWWLAGGTLFGLFMSLGINAEWLNRFLYDYVPIFNKWRAPSSVITSIGVLVSMLGLLGLQKFVQLAKTDVSAAKKKLFIGGGIAIGTTLLLLLLGPAMFDFSNVRDAESISRMLGQSDQATIAKLVESMEETRASIFRADALRSLLFMALSGGAAFLFLRGTLSVTIMAVILSLLVVVDFTGVSTRYVQKDEYQRKRKVDQSYEPTAADQQILQDPDPHYRVFNTMTGDAFQDGLTSYHHKSVGGYHPAKLQRYQDLIDRHLTKGNQAVFNMLNTKYYLVNGAQGPAAQRNPNALGNAWIVNNVQTVNSANAEIDALGGSFDPATTAIVHQDFSSAVSGLQASGQGTVALTSYSPMELKYQFSSPAEQLVVFSEIWYGPDAGWNATIDGEAAEIIRANYALRALRVPAGQHEIVMNFAPTTYTTGYVLSLISSLLIILGLIAYGVMWYRNQPAATENDMILDQPAPKQKTSRKKK
jgi:hypothetical protein